MLWIRMKGEVYRGSRGMGVLKGHRKRSAALWVAGEGVKVGWEKMSMRDTRTLQRDIIYVSR